MKFSDSEVHSLDLTSASGMQKLVEMHLCGHGKLAPLKDSDKLLLDDYVA
jgi:hypothetical protein